MDYFLVYPSRAMVGEQEFIAYHSFLEAAILRVSVFPFIVMTIQNIFLFLLFFYDLVYVMEAYLFFSLIFHNILKK